MRREHPSNRLYRNEIEDFRTGVILYKQALRYEQQFGDDEEFNDWCKKFSDEADAALAIYEKHQKAMIEAASQEMRDAGLEDWALALTTGEYQHLAV